ncbi:hypothetical protein V8C37DRAFT_109499 [Trichoderma ceciliae]
MHAPHRTDTIFKNPTHSPCFTLWSPSPWKPALLPSCILLCNDFDKYQRVPRKDKSSRAIMNHSDIDVGDHLKTVEAGIWFFLFILWIICCIMAACFIWPPYGNWFHYFIYLFCLAI